MRIRDFFDPSRWRSFYIYLLRSHLKEIDQTPWTPEVYEVEQFMYRYLRCPDCLKKGECIHCGCAIPERMHNRTDYCSEYRWGEFFETEEEWNKFKKNNGIVFKLEQYDKI